MREKADDVIIKVSRIIEQALEVAYYQGKADGRDEVIKDWLKAEREKNLEVMHNKNREIINENKP